MTLPEKGRDWGWIQSHSIQKSYRASGSRRSQDIVISVETVKYSLLWKHVALLPLSIIRVGFMEAVVSKLKLRKNE